MGINAGNMRDRITLQRPDTTRAANGESIQRFITYATVRAEVVQQRSSRAFNTGENWYPTARTFKLRMPPEVRGGDRIIHRGSTYVALPGKVFSRYGYQEVDCELLNE